MPKEPTKRTETETGRTTVEAEKAANKVRTGEREKPSSEEKGKDYCILIRKTN